MVPPPVCPSGHTSESTDYCDICGSPMASAGAASGGPAPAPTPAAPKPMGVVCPNCEVMNAPGALFCEACGYDYTTGTMPRPPEPSVLDLDAPLPDAPAGPVSAVDAPASLPDSGSGTPAPAGDASGSAPSSAADPAAVASAAAALDIDTPAPQQSPTAPPAPPPAEAPPATAAPAAASGGAPSGGPTPGIGAEAPGDTFEWVLEIWIDPEWYALQESPDPMPSAGLPDIIPLRKRSLLIGRPSRSRNIHPDIDCEPDTGISRRQAQLTSDGTRWFIEDLGSANGTFVAEASQGMPTDPIPTGRRYELDGDERIYLGAWTRLVLRRATPEELEAYASA